MVQIVALPAPSRGPDAGDHLDGNFPSQAGIRGFVDLAHAPGAERLEYDVGAEASAFGDRHGEIVAGVRTAQSAWEAIWYDGTL